MQPHKVPMGRKQFRIGDLADELKVKKFIIRFWEKEFDLKSDRSEGGQRFYTSDDLKIFLLIKDLLYKQGFTIAGAKKQLENLLAQKAQEALVVQQQSQAEVAVEVPIQNSVHDVTPAETLPGSELTPVAEEHVMAVDAVPEQDHVVHEESEAPLVSSGAELIQSEQLDEQDESVTPATVVPCTCSAISEELKVIKDKLLMLKQRVESL